LIYHKYLIGVFLEVLLSGSEYVVVVCYWSSANIMNASHFIYV